MNQEMVTVSISIPKELKNIVEGLSVREHRSLSNMTTVLLYEILAQKNIKPDEQPTKDCTIKLH